MIKSNFQKKDWFTLIFVKNYVCLCHYIKTKLIVVYNQSKIQIHRLPNNGIIYKNSAFYATNSFWKFSTILHTDNFHVRGWKNTARVNHHRCCAIAEILWGRSRLPEVSKFLKILDSYVTAAIDDNVNILP